MGMGGRIGGQGGYEQPQYGGGYPAGPGKGRAPLAPPGQYPGAVQREQPSIQQEATGLSSAELLELSDEELERYIPTTSQGTSTHTYNFTPSSEDFRKELQAGLDRQMNLQPGDRGFGVGPRLYNPIDSRPPAVTPRPSTLRPVAPPQIMQPMPFSSYGSPGKGMRPQPYGGGFGRGFGRGFGGYQPSPYMPPSPYGGSFGGVFNQGYGVPRGIGSLLSSYPSYMPPRMHFNPYVR